MKDPIYYAIGDVHGRADHLSKTLEFIEADAKYWNGRAVIYFLGDIVDRGSESLQALELVHAALAKFEGSALHLGNHDAWFLDAVKSEGKGPEVQNWLDFGGVNTLCSFFPDLHNVQIGQVLKDVAAQHPHLIEMLDNARLLTSHGRMVFCHAGVDRFENIENQTKDVLIWVRSPFLEIANDDQHVVVHGHTIFKRGPIVTDNRISLDTGCYESNRLSTLRVDPKRRSIAVIVTSDKGMSMEIDEVEPVLLDRGYGTAMDRLDEIFDNWTPMEDFNEKFNRWKA